MITFDEFQAEWLGKRVDYDHVYGFQCVDLIRQGFYEMYNLPGGGGVPSAITYWQATPDEVLQKFIRIPNSEAQKGDVVILWGLPGNADGHIGWATGNTTATMVEILEQNGQTGNGSGTGGDAIRTRSVDRSRVAGLLRPISITQEPVPPTILVTPFATPQQFSHGGSFWNLDQPNFDTIRNNPLQDTNPNPVTITAYLTRSDLPQYVYYLPDASVHHGYNKLDCTAYTPPVINPAPSVINTPTPTVPVAEKYTLVTTLVYFPTAEDAKQRTPKALGPVFEGTYYVVGRDAQAVKLSKDNKTDIGWINTNDNRLPIPEPVIAVPTLPVDPPKVVTEPVNVNPAPIVDIAPAQKDIPWNWLNADHSPTVYRYKGTMPVPIRDLEGTKPPLTMGAGLQGPISRFTEIQGRTYLIPDSEFKKGNAYGIPQQLMAPIHQNILQEAEGDVLKFWDNFEDLPKKVYTLISDISPVKRHEVIYKGRQFIDGFKKGSKK